MIFSEQLITLENTLASYFDQKVTIQNSRILSGGCINTVYQLQTNVGSFCVKMNDHCPEDFFTREASGLQALKETNTILVPEVIHVGNKAKTKYLLQCYIDGGLKSNKYWENFGVQLASLHRTTHKKFGWHEFNYIGSLLQQNQWHSNFCDFFITERIESQLRFSDSKIPRKFLKQFSLLFTRLETLIPKALPALLHGDLWSGNILAGRHGEPYILDPAVYFGHREAELAFTQLFGGFERPFYEAYFSEFPVEPGFAERLSIYNLYPLLVHFNLFGETYLPEIELILNYYA